MKAIRIHEFGSPQVMVTEDVTLPQPGPDEILVEIRAVGVNPVDTYIRAGWYGPRKFPFTPGMDAAGVVSRTGSKGTAFSTGQRVFVSGSVTGTYAQQALCKISQVHPLPDAVSFEQGAALGVPYGTAWRALVQRARATAGQTVLVHGATGGVGLAAVQLAKAAGLKVLATAGSPAGRQVLDRQGADGVLDHHDPAHFEQVIEATGGAGVDIVLEMLANVNLGEDLKITARCGSVVVIGSRGPVEIDPRDIMSRELNVMGVMSTLACPQEKEAMWAGIQKGLENGSIVPVIAKAIPLDQAARAHQEVIESSHQGKIILVP